MQRTSGDDAEIEGSPDRLIFLSDGIYAIAMTLLVLDVKIPDGLDAARLPQAIAHLWPQLAAYMVSFCILGNFWRDQRRLFLRVRRVDATLIRLTLVSLGAIALLPFPTALLAEYLTQPLAVALYAGAITLIVALHLAMALVVWRREHLQGAEITDELARGVILDFGATVVFFGLSVPVAFISTRAAFVVWLLLIPVKIIIGHRNRTAVQRTDH